MSSRKITAFDVVVGGGGEEEEEEAVSFEEQVEMSGRYAHSITTMRRILQDAGRTRAWRDGLRARQESARSEVLNSFRRCESMVMPEYSPEHTPSQASRAPFSTFDRARGDRNDGIHTAPLLTPGRYFVSPFNTEEAHWSNSGRLRTYLPGSREGLDDDSAPRPQLVHSETADMRKKLAEVYIPEPSTDSTKWSTMDPESELRHRMVAKYLQGGGGADKESTTSIPPPPLASPPPLQSQKMPDTDLDAAVTEKWFGEQARNSFFELFRALKRQEELMNEKGLDEDALHDTRAYAGNFAWESSADDPVEDAHSWWTRKEAERQAARERAMRERVWGRTPEPQQEDSSSADSSSSSSDDDVDDDDVQKTKNVAADVVGPLAITETSFVQEEAENDRVDLWSRESPRHALLREMIARGLPPIPLVLRQHSCSKAAVRSAALSRGAGGACDVDEWGPYGSSRSSSRPNSAASSRPVSASRSRPSSAKKGQQSPQKHPMVTTCNVGGRERDHSDPFATTQAIEKTGRLVHERSLRGDRKSVFGLSTAGTPDFDRAAADSGSLIKGAMSSLQEGQAMLGYAPHPAHATATSDNSVLLCPKCGAYLIPPIIDLAHQSLGDEYTELLANVLDKIPLLQHLNLRDNRLTDFGVMCIVNTVCTKVGCGNLLSLDLSDNDVDTDAARALANFMKSSNCALTSLTLAHSDLDDVETAMFCDALEVNRTLKTLDLSHNIIGGFHEYMSLPGENMTGGKALAWVLTANGTLETLDVSWNRLSRESAVEIGHALRTNTSLTWLNVSHNAFGEAGGLAVGSALFVNPSLKHLDMSYNAINGKAAVVIGGGLGVNTSISNIQLNGNPLGMSGGRAILRTFNQVQVPRTCGMDGCNMDIREEGSFDPNYADGEYRLELNLPYDRTIALTLLNTAAVGRGCWFKSVHHTPANATQRTEIKLRKPPPATLARKESKKESSASPSHWRKLHERTDSLTHLKHHDDVSPKKTPPAAGGGKLKRQDSLKGAGQWKRLAKSVVRESAFAMLSARQVSRQVKPVEDASTGQPWLVPDDGILEVVFSHFPLPPTELQLMNATGIRELIDLMKRDPQNRIENVELWAQDMVLECSQVQDVITALSDSKRYAMSSVEIVEFLQRVLPCVIDTMHVASLLEANINASAMRQLQAELGQAWPIILGMPTGHYHLNLSHESDFVAAKKLCEINNTERMYLKQYAGLSTGGTSQAGDWNLYRNVRFNKKRVEHVTDGMMGEWISGRKGLLEVDYVSVTRPQAGRVAMDATDFVKMLVACRLADDNELDETRRLRQTSVLKRKRTLRQLSRGMVSSRKLTAALAFGKETAEPDKKTDAAMKSFIAKGGGSKSTNSDTTDRRASNRMPVDLVTASDILGGNKTAAAGKAAVKHWCDARDVNLSEDGIENLFDELEDGTVTLVNKQPPQRIVHVLRVRVSNPNGLFLVYNRWVPHSNERATTFHPRADHSAEQKALIVADPFQRLQQATHSSWMLKRLVLNGERPRHVIDEVVTEMVLSELSHTQNARSEFTSGHVSNSAEKRASRHPHAGGARRHTRHNQHARKSVGGNRGLQVRDMSIMHVSVNVLFGEEANERAKDLLVTEYEGVTTHIHIHSVTVVVKRGLPMQSFYTKPFADDELRDAVAMQKAKERHEKRHGHGDQKVEGNGSGEKVGREHDSGGSSETDGDELDSNHDDSKRSPHALRQSLPASMRGPEDACHWQWVGKSEADELDGETGGNRLSRALLDLRTKLGNCYISSAQAVTIARLFPDADGSNDPKEQGSHHRQDAVVYMFTRIIDLDKNFNDVMDTLCQDSQTAVISRLGWLNVLNPLTPDRYFQLDLSHWDHWRTASILTKLANEEPGVNWKRQEFARDDRKDWIAGWTLPVHWASDADTGEQIFDAKGVPHQGHLKLQYSSRREDGCAPVVAVRRELCKLCLVSAKRPPHNGLYPHGTSATFTADDLEHGGGDSGGGEYQWKVIK